MPSEADNEPYRITGCTLFSKIIGYFLSNAFLIYYTYSYAVIPKELAYENVSICFLTFIIIDYVRGIPNLVEILYTCLHMGEMTTKNLWKSIVPNNRRPLVYIQWLNWASLAFGCYFISKFIPVGTDNCDIYAGVSPNACVSLQIISVFTIIGLVILGVLLLFLCCFCCCIVCKGGSLPSSPSESSSPRTFHMSFHTYVQENQVLRAVSDQVLARLPIVSGSDSDQTCPICLAEALKGDEGKTEQWMILVCNHKFHPECIQPWLSEHKTCPICRKEQTITEVVSPV